MTCPTCDRMMLLIADIRIAAGVGEKPMADELPEAIKQAIRSARTAGAALMRSECADGWDGDQWDGEDIESAILTLDPEAIANPA